MSTRKYHNEAPAMPLEASSGTATNDFNKKKVSQKWEIAELEEYFSKTVLPEGPLRLSECEMVPDVKAFIESHIRTVKKHNGNKTFYPYYERLLDLRKIIERS
jgi:hypothetical protein